MANGIVLCIHHDDKKWPEFFNSFNKFTKQEDNHKRFRRLNGNKSHVSLSEEQYAVWLYFCCDYKKRMKPLSIIFLLLLIPVLSRLFIVYFGTIL